MHTPPYPLIEGFWIRNYKVFRQIAIGSSFQQAVVTDFSGEMVPYELSQLTLFVGDSGTGKSTILDVFAFLADCLNFGVAEALNHRGGFESVYHFGGEGPISLGIVYRPCAELRSLTYVLNINWDRKTQHPFVETEAIIYRDHQPGSQPRPILLFQNGEKRTRLIQSWVGASESTLEQVKQTDSAHLGLVALAQFEDLPDIPLFKLYLDKFFVSHYVSNNAANLAPAQFKRVPCGNLTLDLKRVKDKHPDAFTDILDVIAKRLPGVEKINFHPNFSDPGRFVLSFKITGHDTPIYSTQLGEGTLRLLSHLTLLEDSIPTPLLGMEDPAAFMGYSQIVAFVEMLQHHIRDLGGTQFLVTTNSNVLIDQMDPTEVWFLTRDNNGVIQASRGLDELQFLGIDLNTIGPYWYSQYLYLPQVTNPMTGSLTQPSPPPPTT
jgi:predicted ATPase